MFWLDFNFGILQVVHEEEGGQEQPPGASAEMLPEYNVDVPMELSEESSGNDVR